MNSTSIEFYKGDLARKHKFLAAVNADLETVPTAEGEIKLQARAKQLLEQIGDLEEKIAKQDRESNIPLRQCSMFANDLPKIDFRDAMDEIVELLKSFRNSRGDVLLLLQQHLAMAGDLCLRRIQDDLKQATGDFKFYKLGFHSGESLDENGLLNQLAGHLNLVQERDLELLADSIINKICNSVRSGSIIYLEIHKWDDFPFQRTTLSWFIQKFWIPLVTRLDDRAKYARVKFVAVIVVDSELSPDCFESPCLCELDKHNLFRWLKLTLRNWTQEEIQEWLETYSGIGNPSSNRQAKNIFSGSLQGIPSLVRQKLEQDLILN